MPGFVFGSFLIGLGVTLRFPLLVVGGILLLIFGRSR